MKMTRGERIFSVFNIIFMCVLNFIMLAPMLYVLTLSIMPEHIISQHNHELLLPIPKYITLESYRYIFAGNSQLIHAYSVTAFLVIVGTAINIVFTMLMAYPLSKTDLKGRTAVMLYVFITMLIGGGLIPTYLVVKATGLIDSLWALIIPNLISPWYMIIMRNFFAALPQELLEAAMMDGAGEFTILWRIVVPLSIPVIATMSLFYGVGYWNNFFGVLIYINSPSKWTLQPFLRQVLIEASPRLLQESGALQEMLKAPPPMEQVKMATIMAATVPILVIYPFVQKYFVKGVMIGSVKG